MEFNTISYEEALDTIEFYLELADQAGITPYVCFAPIDGVYEILGEFHEVGDAEYIGLDNEYVTEEVALQVNRDFGIPIMEIEEQIEDVYGVPT